MIVMTIKLKNLNALFSDREIAEVLGNSRQAVNCVVEFKTKKKIKLLLRASKRRFEEIKENYDKIVQDGTGNEGEGS